MNDLRPGTRVQHILTGRYGTVETVKDRLANPDYAYVRIDGVERLRTCNVHNLRIIEQPEPQAATSLILVGIENDGTSYEFRPQRGFLNDEAGIEAARQYINLLIEARPYDSHPLVKVVGLGLTGNPDDNLTRDRGVEIGELFPIEPVVVEPIPNCVDNTGKGDCALPMIETSPGVFHCSMHASKPATCANTGRNLDTPCSGEVLVDDESGLMLCAAHREA